MKITRRKVLSLLSGFVGFSWLSGLKCSPKTIGVDPAKGGDQTIIAVVGETQVANSTTSILRSVVWLGVKR